MEGAIWYSLLNLKIQFSLSNDLLLMYKLDIYYLKLISYECKVSKWKNMKTFQNILGQMIKHQSFGPKA